MGVKDYFFKKYKITYYQYSWQHTLFFVFSLALLFFVYKDYFINYFDNQYLSLISSLFILFALWLLAPKFYKNDYFTNKERFLYAIPKFFEILFQQFGFLAGLLTFGLPPTLFGLVFFAIHIPVLFFIPRRFALVFIGGSFLGGIIFAYLQSLGENGFLLAVLIHFLFYICFHCALSSGRFPKIIPHKR
jgi:hypothetical protein